MKKNLYTILLSSLLFIGCKKEEGSPENPTAPANESEVITTVILMLTDSNGQHLNITWKDADGIGPQQPVVQTLNIGAHQTYSGKVLLLDETKNPVDTISHEVAEEAEAHQFFYTFSEPAGQAVTLTRQGVDANNLPVGLSFTIHTTDSANGTLKVVLKHYDGFPKSTDPSIGETDVEVAFPMSIHL